MGLSGIGIDLFCFPVSPIQQAKIGDTFKSMGDTFNLFVGKCDGNRDTLPLFAFKSFRLLLLLGDFDFLIKHSGYICSSLHAANCTTLIKT